MADLVSSCILAQINLRIQSTSSRWSTYFPSGCFESSACVDRRNDGLSRPDFCVFLTIFSTDADSTDAFVPAVAPKKVYFWSLVLSEG